MSRFQLRLSPMSRGTKLVLAGFTTLVLVVTAAVLVPRGDDPEDGLAPTTGGQYVARDTAPGPSPVTAEAQAEIGRVLAAAPTRVSAREAPRRLAADLVRCAEFEEQQYCLGVGWTDASPAQVQARALAPTTRARAKSVETTGDLPTADLLAQRAALPPAERLAAERAELVAAARAVAKVVLLRHQLLGEPLPDGFLDRHPEARADATAPTTARTTTKKRMKDYPRRSTVLNPRHVRAQVRTYWCGPTTMQMIGWGWQQEPRRQRYWARQLGTTTSGSAISEMVRVVNEKTGYDKEKYAGAYIVLDISDWGFKKWMLLQMRHIEDYRAPVVLHPLLHKEFYPYLDDDASGHFQVGRGYDKRGDKPDYLGYFEPWNQQRFDPSEPYIARVQWRQAFRSYRANQAHPHQNIGV
jgi:hypothetical protein